MKYSIIVLCLVTMACGKKSSDPSIKGIFSSWQMTGCTNGGVQDLTQGSIGTNFPSSYTYKSGEKCNCTANYNSSSLYTISSCTYVPGTGLGSDPGCAVHHNDSGTYYVSGSSVLSEYSSTLAIGDSICLTFN